MAQAKTKVYSHFAVVLKKERPCLTSCQLGKPNWNKGPCLADINETQAFVMTTDLLVIAIS